MGEITHGRVGMLASLGFLVQEKFHPLFTADGGPAIEQIPKLPPALWVAMTIGIGACEALRIQKGWANPYEKMENVQMLKDEYTPGDLGFDPLGFKPTDPAELREMQEKELSHGRLGQDVVGAGRLVRELPPRPLLLAGRRRHRAGQAGHRHDPQPRQRRRAVKAHMRDLLPLLVRRLPAPGRLAAPTTSRCLKQPETPQPR